MDRGLIHPLTNAVRLTSSSRPHAWLLACLLLVSCAAWLGAGCTGGEEKTPGKTVAGRDVEAKVGEAVTLGEVKVSVTSLAPTLRPAMPDEVLLPGEPPPPRSGEEYYQVRVRLENPGPDVARVDPRDFTMVAGDTQVTVDPTQSGPAPRSLLHGTSFEVLLTFRVPIGSEPYLVFDAPWYGGTLTVKGVQKSGGQALHQPSLPAAAA